VSNYTDLLRWWNQTHLEFPDLVRMTRLYLTVPATSEFVSPERIFSRVGLVKTDFSVWEHSGHHHDWSGSDSDVGKTSTLNHTFHLLTHPYVYKASLYLTHQYIRITVTLTSPHTLTYLTNYQPC
jgi:hypothetical protein